MTGSAGPANAAGDPPQVVRLERVSKRFGPTVALDDVDFDVHGGEVHVLVGENGAGKSTLVKILSGAYHLDEGTLLVDGVHSQFHGPRDALDAGIATVYQEFNLVPHLTVAQNLFLGHELSERGWLNRRAMLARTNELIAELDIDIRGDATVATLGVAQLQMVEIMRALVGRSFKLLILDEPTAALARHEIDVLLRVIRALIRRGIGVLYISHRLEEIHQIGHRVTVFRDGRRVITRPVRDVHHEQIVEWMVGRSIEQLVPERQVETGDERLAVYDLTLRSGKARNVSFAVRSGEVLGVFGLMGAGRTETLRALFGLEAVADGAIAVEGRRARPRTPRHAVALGLGLAPEDRKREGIVPDASVAANINLSALRHGRAGRLLSPRKLRAQAAEYVQRMRIAGPGLDAPMRQLSGGNQQKCVLARLLAADANVLLLDEPTRGIDVGAKEEVYQLINELAAQGTAVVFVSSDLREVIGIADRVAVYRRGSLVEVFDRVDATEEAVLRAAVPERMERDEVA